MSYKPSFAGPILAAAALLACSLAGCASCASGFASIGSVEGWSASSLCHGYYPTCWRPWPEECPPCPPPYGTMPPIVETVKPPMPVVPPTPPVEETPAPLPFEPLPPGDDEPPAAPRPLDLTPPRDNSMLLPLPGPEPVARSEVSSRRRWVEANYTTAPSSAYGGATLPAPTGGEMWSFEVSEGVMLNPFTPAPPESR